jgi:competence protein ComEC
VLVIAWAVYIEFFTQNNRLEAYYGKTISLSGIVSDDINYKKDDYRIRLKTDYGTVYVMLAKLPNDVLLSRSDLLTLRGVLEPGFGNYAAFLYRPTVEKVAHSDLPDFARQIRDSFTQSVREQLANEEQNSLVLSYLTGQKNLLSEEQSQKLRLAGLAHVVVASGYHLAVVVGLAKKLFGKLSRFATFGGALLLLVAYISVTGFTASMARAGLVTVMSLWAWYFGRRFHPLRLLLYAAAITLIIDASFISNIAWQLSFSSYAGIIFFTPVLAKLFYGDKKPGYFASIIIASISAQVFCLPLTLYYFGIFPTLALVSNVLITPTIPALMLCVFLLGITRFLPLVFVSQKILEFQIFIIDSIASLPWAGFDFGAGDSLAFLLYIPIIASLLFLRWRTRYSYRPSYAKIYAC